MLTRTLPADVARCHGVNVDGQWREGCEDCLRRTSPATESRPSADDGAASHRGF